MLTISSTTVYLVLATITVFGAVFAVFFYFQKPQIALDKRMSKVEENIKDLQKEVTEVKRVQFENNGAIQTEMKDMTTAINELSKTVVRLSTIIDERIPKGSPALTPSGQ